jgi:hypothetical protein
MDQHPSKTSSGVPIRSLVLALSFISSAVPLGWMSWQAAQNVQEQTVQAATAGLDQLHRSNVDRSKKWLASQESGVIATGQSPDLIVALQDPNALGLWAQTPQRFEGRLAWSLAGPDGTPLVSSTPADMPNVAQSAHFKAVMGGAPVHTQASVVADANRGALLIAAPVVQPGTPAPLAVLTEIKDIAPLAASWETDKGTSGATSYLVSATGQVLAHASGKKVGSAVGPEVMSALTSGASGQRATSAPSSAHATVTESVGPGLLLVTDMDRTPIQAAALEQKNKALLMGAPFLALSLLLSWLVSGWVSRKLQRVAAIAQGISQTRETSEVVEWNQQLKRTGGSRELRKLSMAVSQLTQKYRVIVTRHTPQKADE